MDRMGWPWKHPRPEDGLPNPYAIIRARSFSEKYRVAPTTVIPCGKAIELMRKPESMTLPGIAATAGGFAIGLSNQAGPRAAGIDSPSGSSAGTCTAQNTISGIR